MKVTELLDEIAKKDAVLPEFQREYVWSREQAKQLLVSLTRDYPVGGLLFWRTDEPPELKNITKLPEKLGAMHVILDGQQRLTTLFMLIRGEIPPYYTDHDIQNDPRDLYYNIDTREFEYYSSRMQGNPLWIRVVECFSESVNVFKIAEQVSADGATEAFELAQRYQNSLERLKSIRTMDLPVQLVPSHAGIDDAIDVFDRVNSQGTKLTEAELALTHITGKWAQARRIIKAKMTEIAEYGFEFDLTFMTRALTGTVTRRALFEFVHDRPEQELKAGWKSLSSILDYLVALLPSSAYVHSTQDLNTTNVLIPLIVFLSVHGGEFPSKSCLRNAIHWLYAAHTWARYTAQTDQRLEHDVSLVVRLQDPWDLLCEQILDQRGRIEVRAADLQGRGTQHPLYRMMAITAKASGAIDWFNGVPLGATCGKAYSVNSHHIFPTSLLYKEGYDPENHLHRKVVNEIANRAFLTATSNQSLSATRPEEYLAQVEQRYPGALAKQFVPMDPSLWRVDRYADFLERRRGLIASKINDYLSSLISEPQIVHERPVSDLIGLGESATLEFKSTLQWDMVEQRVNKQLRFSVLKTVAAFLNSAGGTLVLGVEDDGNVCGLEHDLGALQGSTDRFEQLLANLLAQYVGGHIGGLVRTRFEKLGTSTVCIVDVDRASAPIFVKEPSGTVFYVRFGNTTRQLDPEETLKYTQTNWE